jgi:hypothetical protein
MTAEDPRRLLERGRVDRAYGGTVSPGITGGDRCCGQSLSVVVGPCELPGQKPWHTVGVNLEPVLR